MLKNSLVLITCLFSVSSYAAGVTYEGVYFPDGDISFADAVVSYTPGNDVGATSEGVWNDPSVALGIPDIIVGPPETGLVSLGDSGVLILQFTDNALTTSGNSDQDLWIFEGGDVVETFNLAISIDNINWINLGDISGQPTGVDIDAVPGVVAGQRYSYVKLTDISPNQTNAPYGEADIDAVGAVSSASPAPPVAPIAGNTQNIPIFGPFGILAMLMGLLWCGKRHRSS